MKLKTSNKTVMFYGSVLRVNIHAKWIAVDENGEVKQQAIRTGKTVCGR